MGIQVGEASNLQWEYMVLKAKSEGKFVPNLDEYDNGWFARLGDKGWELIQVVPLPRGGGRIEQTYFYFKRPKGEWPPEDAQEKDEARERALASFMARRAATKP